MKTKKHSHRYNQRYFDGSKTKKKCRCGKREPYHHIVKQAIKKWLYNNRYLFIILFFASVGGLVIYYNEYKVNKEIERNNIGYVREDTGVGKQFRIAQSGYNDSTNGNKFSRDQNIKKEVLEMFTKEGLNPDVAECVIFQESGFKEEAFNPKTLDMGIMQWNIQHIKSGLVTPKCAFTAACAADKAIKKVKADGGWRAWYGYKDADCGRFGKTFIN